MSELEEIDPPPPCTKCDGLELWQNPLGEWRCLRCDPPHPYSRVAYGRKYTNREMREWRKKN
jgi:hypothetical protein